MGASGLRRRTTLKPVYRGGADVLANRGKFDLAFWDRGASVPSFRVYPLTRTPPASAKEANSMAQSASSKAITFIPKPP